MSVSNSVLRVGDLVGVGEEYEACCFVPHVDDSYFSFDKR